MINKNKHDQRAVMDYKNGEKITFIDNERSNCF